MFPKYIKLVLASLCMAYAAYMFFDIQVGNGIMWLLFSGIFFLLYFKNEIIFIAFLRMRKQDLTGTKKLLQKIKNPQQSLVKKQHGYYHLMWGIIESKNNFNTAEKHFRMAIKLGLNMSFDKAMARIGLAGILMQKRRKRESARLLNEAKRLDKHNMLAEQIRLMKQQMRKI